MLYYTNLIAPTPTQIHQILELYAAENWWTADRDRETLLKKIITGSHCFMVAVKSGDIVGMGRAISDGASDAYIQDVTVKKEFRGQGIGSEIIKHIIQTLKKDKIGWIGLIAEKGSAGFYEKLDFNPMDNSCPMVRLEK